VPGYANSHSRSHARSLERVAAICERDDDSLPLRQAVLAEVRRVVGFDAHVFVLTDPETSVGAAPLADVPPPVLPLLPRLIALKYRTAVNRWTAMESAVATLRGATGDDPARSLVWRELLAELGVADVASGVFRDRFGCWGFLDLWRCGGPFAGPEVSYLDGIASAVTAGLRRAQARTFRSPPGRPPVAPGPVVLLLSGELRVLGQTSQTHDYLRALVPPAQGQAPIPASAYNVAAQLLAVEEGVDANPPRSRVHLADGLWLSLRAARLDAVEPGGDRHIAVTIEEAAPAERTVLFGRSYGLSARETEVLNYLRAGLDTRDVAAGMHVSEHTVQDHLKSVFAKTGTRSRRTLLARATGT
jgi:DNA-binding CsgD family transcriptional regulator